LPLLGSGVLYHLSFMALPQACEIRYSYMTVLFCQVGITVVAASLLRANVRDNANSH